MRNISIIWLIFLATGVFSCDEILDPKPVDLLIDEIALNEPEDVINVRIGLYASLRSMASLKVLAGDFTADMLYHNGTYSQYREFGTKEITASNSTVAALWASIYRNVYVANIILEKLPEINGVSTDLRELITAEAHFVRGYSYFVGLTSFGKMPLINGTDVNLNSNLQRSTISEVLQRSLSDLEHSINGLPTQATKGYLTSAASYAALARLYLYYEEWENAYLYSNAVIESGLYELEGDFMDIVLTDFTDEAILEVGYTLSDDPGTSVTGLNNLFIGRREIIPSNEIIFALSSNESGDRFGSIGFDSQNLSGTDNGWSVIRYGSGDEDNNNIILFRLAEMYLIRAEASNELGDLTQASTDINTLRSRANAVLNNATGYNQMKSIIEKERLYELAFEGHRWYDLKRTGRLNDVMNVFSQNWKTHYNLWPVPLREIQLNPGLANDQNPGY